MTSQRAKYGFISTLVIVTLVLVNLPVALAGTGVHLPRSPQTTATVVKELESPNVVVTVGGGGTYATLKAAFDDINSGVLTGTIQLDVIGDTTETATAVLNASGTLTASYASVLIQPSGGSRVISGTMPAGSSLIDLNGADNVTIDGLNTGGNALTIVNSTASATSGTSTIRFIGGATNNTVTNATVLGAFSATVATNGGNIYFATDGLTTNGNDNNTISNSKIGPVSPSALPTKGVYSNGSTTTTAINNSGNVITGNEIFDYFGAAVTSGGVYIAGGSTDFTISNNKFYQTATRTLTANAQHSAIWIANTSGNNFQITGNIIGYADAAGTSTYNFVGFGTTSRFIAIYLNIGGTTASSVQGNTITAINIGGVTGGTGTTSAFMGISVPAGLATIGNVTGNTIGSLTASGAISLTNTTTSAFEVYGIYYFPSAAANVSNSAVGGMELTNNGTAALTFYGLRAFTTSTAANVLANNTVGSSTASIVNTSSSTSSRTIGIYSQSGSASMTGNTVQYLTMNAGNVGTGSSASLIGLWVDGTSAAGHTVSRNMAYALSNTNGTAAVWVTGLHYNGSTSGTNLVARNLIYNLSTPSTSATATVNGINVQGGTTTYQNNMVALGNDLTATSPQINGINEVVAGADNFYFNSVYIGGAAVAAGTANSFAFQSSITTTTRNYRNNIFFNARSNGAATGKHYAIRVGGTAPNPAGLTSNNNVITVTGAGGFAGLFNAVDQATLANWQAATGQDLNSFALDPQFIAPAAATPDLHISSVVTTVVEGNGFLIGSVADDFDGNTRADFTPTDIGADAGNFTGTDLAGPAIVYPPFGDTSLTSNRVLATNLSDVTGVPTAGALQSRIYYNKNGGAWFSSQGALVGGTGLNGTWNFTVTVSDLGGVAAGDVISYFVIAQDTASPANLASNPAGAVASDVNTITTPPNPYTYTIVSAFSGSYNVGATEVYTSLTNAGGIFQAINAGALTGNVIVNITSDLVGETGLHALNQWIEDGAGGYTLLIRPSGSPVTVTGSINGALIRFFGTDRVTLDGSLSGGSDRSLTIQNTNTGTSAAVIAVQSGASGAQNNTIKNVNVLGQDPTTTLLGIALGGDTVGTVGTDNDGNRVENNAIRRAIFGLYSAGQNAVNPNTGTVITKNDLTGAGTDRIRRVGILVFNENGVQITQNSIGEINSSESADAIGIGVGIQALNNTTTTGGGVTNAVVTQNLISSVTQTNTFSAAGIAVAGGAGGPNTIANNMISGIRSNATSPDLVAGVYVVGATGSDTRLYYNSVSLTGDRGATATQMPSYGLAVTGADPTVTVQDNILYTTQTASGGGANAKSYAIGMVASTFVNLNSNYNLFYAGGANVGYFRTGSLGAGAGTDYATLADWQTAVGDDANSLFVDPLFVSDTADLHLQPASQAIDAGTPVAGITTDIDGQPRLGPPDIGADEIPQDIAIALIKTVGADPAVCAATTTITVTEGSDVTYCYNVENTGNVTFTTHTLTDTVLGTLLSNSTINLAPGASTFITASQNIITNTTNTASWTASAGGYTATASASATVNTLPAFVPNPAIVFTKTVGTAANCSNATHALTVTVGTVVYYCFGVTNTGNVTFTLHTVFDPLLGINQTLPAALPPGLSVGPIPVSYTTNLTGTLVNTAVFTSTNGVQSASDSDSAVLTVQSIAAVYGVNARAITAAQSGYPGTMLTYQVRITNTGSVVDSFTIAAATLPVTFTTNVSPTLVSNLAAGASVLASVQVAVPAGASDGAAAATTVTVTSTGSPATSAAVNLTTISVWRKLYLPVILK